MEPHAGLHRCLGSVLLADRRVHVEVAVAAHAPALVGGDRVLDLVRRVALDVTVLDGGLVGGVVRLLVLEEDRLPVLAVPPHVVLVEVPDEQAGGQDVVTVHPEAVVGPVGLPADALAVVGTPEPGVVDDRVVAVDHHAGGRLAGTRSADPDEHVLERGRVRRVVGRRALGTHLDEHRGVLRTGVDQESGQLHTVDVTDLDRGHPVVRDDRGQAQTEGDRAGAVDLDGLVHVVDARGEEQVQPLAYRRADGLRRRARLHHVEPAQRDRLALRGAVPRDAPRVGALGGDEDFVVLAVEVEEGLLAGDRSDLQVV